MKFLLTTDKSCDIFCSELTARGIEYISQVFTIDDVANVDDFSQDSQYKRFYDLIRAGKMPTTSQINQAEHADFFRDMIAKHGLDILHVTLSSGLSGTYASACAAADEVNAELGETKVYVLDSLGATVVQRLVVDEAERLRNADVSASEALSQMNEFTKHVLVWFMPTDLMHLKRGGRVSGASAVIGTALNIKPILTINKEGGLSVVQKKIGVGNGMAYMASMFEKYSTPSTKSHTVYLPSADSDLKDKMLEKLQAVRNDCNFTVGWVGPVIGAHTGNNMIGVCFYSDNVREV